VRQYAVTVHQKSRKKSPHGAYRDLPQGGRS
jgi:hypothetical protein